MCWCLAPAEVELKRFFVILSCFESLIHQQPPRTVPTHTGASLLSWAPLLRAPKLDLRQRPCA